jgi:hypothetical protein
LGKYTDKLNEEIDRFFSKSGVKHEEFERWLAAEFPKTPSLKPARIPPQTPPAGGKSAEAGRIRNPRQIVSPCRVLFSIFNHLDFARNTFELCPTNTTRKCGTKVSGTPR